MAKVTLLCSYAALFLLLSGCGGGTGNAVPLPVNKGIILSANLKQGIPPASVPPIVGIEVTFVLPKTATPILDTPVSLQISETGLKGLNTNGSVSAGSYDPVTGTVHFFLLPNDVAIGLGTGDIARLTYETSSGAALTPQEIQQTLSYKVVGLGSPDNIDISAQFDTSVSGASVRIVTYLKP